MPKSLHRIKQILDKENLSIFKFEKRVGFSNGAFGNQLKNDRAIGIDKLENISIEFPHWNMDFIITGEGPMFKDETTYQAPTNNFSLVSDTKVEYQSIPLYDIDASAGLVPLFKNRTTKPIDHISIPHLPKCDGAVYVTGDSMYPLLKSGDIVMYKQLEDFRNNIFWGEMYLVSVDMEGEEYIAVKYIQKSDLKDHIRLVSQNQHHADKDVPLTKIRALAFVKASIRINSMR